MTSSILIVEDDTTLAQLVARNLTVRGFSVGTAETVATAIGMLETACPDVLLADIDMPDASGWEVVRRLRHGECRDTRVIVMSGLQPNVRLVKELGCVGVLEKPFPIEALIRLVGPCVERPAVIASEPVPGAVDRA